MYLNPASFSKQFRAELICDLNLTEKLCCPHCIITYIDPDYEGCCTQEDCVFDYANTPITDVIRWWKEAVLRAMREADEEAEEPVGLEAKWQAIFLQHQNSTK